MDAPSKIIQIRLGYISVLVVLILGAFSSFYFADQNGKNTEKVLTGEAQNLDKTQNLALLDGALSIDLRSFLLTGDRFYLEERRRNLRSFFDRISTLSELTTRPEIKNLLNEVKTTRLELSVVAENIIQMKTRNMPSKGIGVYFSTEVAPLRQNLDKSMNALLTTQTFIYEDAKNNALIATDNTRRLLIGIGLLAFLISAGLGWFFSERQIQVVGVLDQTIVNLRKTEADLEGRNLKMEQAVRSRDEMVGIVSHELKNPLAALSLSATLIQKTLSDDPKYANIKKAVNALQPSIRRMNQLISDLLDITRLEARALKFEFGVFDLYEIINEVVKSNEVFAQEKLIQLRSEVPPGIEVYCDRERTTQVLVNLLSNAIKFTNSGGSIRIQASKLENQFEVRVSDTGKGISKESLPHVFDRFWQAKETAHKGTGLGLSIAKGLVEAQNGKIWVDSQLGVGTEFHFTIPAKSSVLQLERRAS